MSGHRGRHRGPILAAHRRHFAWWIARQRGHSLPRIAKAAGAHHTTVMSGIAGVERSFAERGWALGMLEQLAAMEREEAAA